MERAKSLKAEGRGNTCLHKCGDSMMAMMAMMAMMTSTLGVRCVAAGFPAQDTLPRVKHTILSYQIIKQIPDDSNTNPTGTSLTGRRRVHLGIAHKPSRGISHYRSSQVPSKIPNTTRPSRPTTRELFEELSDPETPISKASLNHPKLTSGRRNVGPTLSSQPQLGTWKVGKRGHRADA